MSKKIKKLVIMFVIAGLIIVGYILYSGSNSTETINQFVDTSSSVVPVDTETSGELAQGAEIVKLISLLKGITFDASLFSNQEFRSLDDYSVQLPPVVSGRQNPFAPL